MICLGYKKRFDYGFSYEILKGEGEFKKWSYLETGASNIKSIERLELIFSVESPENKLRPKTGQKQGEISKNRYFLQFLYGGPPREAF